MLYCREIKQLLPAEDRKTGNRLRRNRKIKEKQKVKKKYLKKKQETEEKKTMLEKHIFLIGFMGCGKSTNGRYLSEMTGAALMEMDQEIAASRGMEIAQIFEQYGEAYFRDLETELLQTLREKTPMIVSCGGGVVLREENVALMKEIGTIVLLTASPETIYQRVKGSTHRPILNGNMNPHCIRELMEKRKPRYEAAADRMVSTDQKNRRQICEEILGMQE